MATVSKAEVVDIKHFGKNIREYTLKLEKNKFLESGTFLLLTLEEKEDYTGCPDSRNFSIASTYNQEGIIRLIIQKTGYYTSRIFDELTIGKTCTVKYSFGDFILPFYDNTSPICCIAGGTGIAPILGFCEELAKQNKTDRLHVYYSFKNKEKAVGLDILKKYVLADQLHLYATQQEIAEINCRRIEKQDILHDKIDIRNTHFYICGASDFTKYLKDILSENGSENIYTDEW